MHIFLPDSESNQKSLWKLNLEGCNLWGYTGIFSLGKALVIASVLIRTGTKLGWEFVSRRPVIFRWNFDQSVNWLKPLGYRIRFLSYTLLCERKGFV